MYDTTNNSYHHHNLIFREFSPNALNHFLSRFIEEEIKLIPNNSCWKDTQITPPRVTYF